MRYKIRRIRSRRMLRGRMIWFFALSLFLFSIALSRADGASEALLQGQKISHRGVTVADFLDILTAERA